MVNLSELRAGDTVWWEREDGERFLAKVDHVYANMVDITLAPYTLPFLESTALRQEWVKADRLHLAVDTDGLFAEAAHLAESARKTAVVVAQERGRPLDDMQKFFVQDAVIHAYLTFRRNQQAQE